MGWCALVLCSDVAVVERIKSEPSYAVARIQLVAIQRRGAALVLSHSCKPSEDGGAAENRARTLPSAKPRWENTRLRLLRKKLEE